MSPVAQPSDSVSLTNNSDHSSQNPGVLHGRILEKGDRVRHTFRIGRVTGLDAYEGPDYIVTSLTCFRPQKPQIPIPGIGIFRGF